MEILTALNVPAPGPHPSITSAQWSGDGQMIMPMKNAVFIMTPEIGLNFDSLSLLRTDRRNFRSNGSKDTFMDVGWYRNLIELDKSISHAWTLEVTEPGAVTLGSLDVSWRSVAVSPSNLSGVSTGSGSLLVTMNSNLELTLWCTAKNHLKEPWTRIQDITSTLKELPPPEEDLQHRTSYRKVLQAQVNCITWSGQPEFGVQPNPLIDGSILAMGNRAGSIIFMRYDGKRRLEPIRVIFTGTDWVTHLAWGSWKLSEALHSETCLACGHANGEIVIIRVRQRLERLETIRNFRPAFALHSDFDVLDDRPSDSTDKGITALAWVDRPQVLQEKPTLFYATSGQFHFYQLDGVEIEGSSMLSGRSLGSLRVLRQTTSVDSSSLYPVCGLSRVADWENDVLIVVLFDGSFHVVRDVSSAPKFDHSSPIDSELEDGTSGISVTSSELSRLARRSFVEAEGSALRYADVGRISGAVGFDGLGTFLWLHEACRPTDFSYKHESKHSSMLVVARLWQPPNKHELLLRRISDLFRRPGSGSYSNSTPAAALRPVLLHLGNRKTFDVIWPGVLPLLQIGPDEEHEDEALPVYEGEINEDSRIAFRHSLAVDMYGWEAFHSLRLRLAVADYCWKMSPTDEIRSEFGKSAQALLGNISHGFMKILVKHAAAAINVLNEQDLPFLMRVIVQGLLAGSPPDLMAHAQALSEIAKAKFTDVAPEAFGLTETCPACHSSILLENLLTAVCPRGHTWTRCSITSFLLAVPLVRTCIGCTRKAFLAPSSRFEGEWTVPASDELNLVADTQGPTPSTSLPSPLDDLWVPDAARSWFVDELLEAARCCLYCGNRFIRIL